MNRPDRTTLYAVYWRAEGVLKVGKGRTSDRQKVWVRRGAEVIMQMVDVPAIWEREIHRQLSAAFLQAFDNEGDARWLLGYAYGFSECFIVSPERRIDALALIAKAIAESGAR